MSNKRFYIIGGVILLVVLGVLALAGMDSSTPQAPVQQEDQGIRLSP